MIGKFNIPLPIMYRSFRQSIRKIKKIIDLNYALDQMYLNQYIQAIPSKTME